MKNMREGLEVMMFGIVILTLSAWLMMWILGVIV
jgi:hypothetical protein